MNWIDYTILAIIVISALISLTRGFFRESLSLVSWIAAFIIAGYFYPKFTHYFSFFQDELLREASSALSLFVATLLIGSVVNYLIYQLVNFTGLSGFDRLLGLGFGVLRGILVVSAILFMLDSFTSILSGEIWKESLLLPYFHHIVQWFFDYLQQNSVLLNNFPKQPSPPLPL